MNIIYLSSTASGMHSSSIYYDLLQEFLEHGHSITIVYPREIRDKQATSYEIQNGINYLGVKTLNITKNKNMIEKGISTLIIDFNYKKAIKRHLKGVKFDLLLYSTPPISLIRTVEYLQKINNLKSLLMLKDIFPQNAVDLGLFRKNSFIHKFFRNKELKLYDLFDGIGTMSKANTEYLLTNTNLNSSKAFNLPNSIKVKKPNKNLSREYFDISDDKIVLLYGGNLGRPQSIPFLIECAKSIKDLNNVLFIVAGTGSEEHLIEEFINCDRQTNFKYLGALPVNQYNNLTSVSDIGLIFLDDCFTVPNYPQRILSYMNAQIPVISCTDCNTDVGVESELNGYGISIPSNDVKLWKEAVLKLVEDKKLREEMGIKGYNYLLDNFSVESSYARIIEEYNNLIKLG